MQLLFLLLYMYWLTANQLCAYRHLLYRTGYIHKRAWTWNDVTNVKAGQQRRGSNCAWARYEKILPNVKTRCIDTVLMSYLYILPLFPGLVLLRTPLNFSGFFQIFLFTRIHTWKLPRIRPVWSVWHKAAPLEQLRGLRALLGVSNEASTGWNQHPFSHKLFSNLQATTALLPHFIGWFLLYPCHRFPPLIQVIFLTL